MSDLIKREDAINAVLEITMYQGRVPVDTVLYRISNIPSAEAVHRWIPVSERLPSNDGCYLVSTTGTNNDIIDIAYYTEEIWHKASRITAWMPLPEPYKGGDSE